jgi:Cu(I)/Ag(I) efflux system membrane protein CusA/SilA
MKPLATPVLGGMVSSLVHVLIVTPVIFFAIRERQLGLQDQPLPRVTGRPFGGRRLLLVAALAIALLAGAVAAWRLAHRAGTDASGSTAGRVVQTVRSGDMEIVLLSPTGSLSTGRNAFTIEFRSPSGALVDVGTVRVTANMAMPGMVMPGNVQLQPSGVPGRYTATADFGMAGSWPINIEWNGPAGRGFTTVEGSVQ